MIEGRGHLAAFEWRVTTNEGGYHFDGSLDRHVQWQLVDNNERGQVLQVLFNSNDPFDLTDDNGWIGIIADPTELATADLSAFSSGSISFDMRIMQNGMFADFLDFKMECGYPCSSEEVWIADPAELGVWQSYTIPMHQLIASGLNITQVNNLFIFKPTWGQQLGQYIIELDNIRLNKTFTDESIPPEAPTQSLTKVYYQNGIAADSGFAVTNTGGAMLSEEQDNEGQFLSIQFLADDPFAEFFIFPLAGESYDMTDYFHGDVVFDLRVVNYGDSAGEFLINSFCKWPCRAVPAYSIGRPDLGTWQTHRIPVRELVARGVHLDRVLNGFFLKFEGTGRAGIQINLNNIRWEYIEPTEE